MRREIINKSIFAKSIMLILIVLFWTQLTALARSGCCSHHNGVCGCGCCDGSPLSSTCAPYYPSCNSSTPPKITKINHTIYTQTQYNKIIAEKEKLKKQNTRLQNEKEKINNEKENTDTELTKIKEEKENLKKEKDNLNNKITQLNSARTSILGDLKDSNNNLSEKQTALQKQDSSKENNSSGNGFLTFLLGGGSAYGLNRLKRRSELKKEGVQIKGNITKDGEKIYYTPNNRYYDMVKINKKKGEKWFLSEQEAIDSGWRKV